MPSAATSVDPNITMSDLLARYPGAQRALFQRYHIGGCASCGFAPDETLAGVCLRNENLDPTEVIQHVVESDAADRAMQIEPRELADRIKQGEPAYLLDVRTREEFEAVKLDGAKLFTQELLQEAMSQWNKERLLVIYDHQGNRSMDATAYFLGHGFAHARSLRGGIDAWSEEVDSSLPRYHLETTPQ